MASELRVNTLKDASGNNSIATSFVAGGSAKAWNRFVGSSVATLADSFNNSTATDNGTGDYTFAFTSTMSNANYAPVCNGGKGTYTAGIDGRVQMPDQITTSNFVYNMANLDADAHTVAIDDDIGLTVVHGDLA
jgi:hypothetical protein